MIEKAIGAVRARAALGAGEIAIASGIDRQLEQCFGQACFIGQQGRDIGCLRHQRFELRDQRLQPRRIHVKARFTQRPGVPFFEQAIQTQALQLLGGF